MVTASSDGTIRFWDFAEGSQIEVIYAKRPVLSIALSADERSVAGGLTDGVVKLWKMTNSPSLVCEEEIILARDSRGDVLSVAFSPNDTKLAAGGNNQQHTRIWNLQKLDERCKSSAIVGPVDAMGWVASGEILYANVPTSGIHRWRVNTERSLTRTSNNGRRILLPNATGQPLFLFAHTIFFDHVNQPLYSYQGHVSMSPVSAQLIESRKWLVTADVIVNKIQPGEREPDEFVTVWDLTSGQPLAIMRDRFGQVGNIAVSPDGRHVVYGGGERETNRYQEVEITGDFDLRVWDISNTPNRAGIAQ